MSTEQPTIIEERNERGTPFWRVSGYSWQPTDWYTREHAELHYRVISSLPAVEGMRVYLERKSSRVVSQTVWLWRMTIAIPDDRQEWTHSWDEDTDVSRFGAASLEDHMIRVATRYIEGAVQRIAAAAEEAKRQEAKRQEAAQRKAERRTLPADHWNRNEYFAQQATRVRDLTRAPDGRPLHWPPQYVDLVDGGALHDWDDIVPPAEGEELADEQITWRQLAWDIADEYGGIHDLLSRMWLHLGGEPDVPTSASPAALARPGVKICQDCGKRPGQISSNFNGWVCWPCYESYEDG